MAQVLPFRPIEADPAQLSKASPARRLLGDVLVQSGALGSAALDSALDLQREQDAPLGQILLAERAISAEDLAAALSQQSGLGRIDLHRTPVDAGLLDGLDPCVCLDLEAVPWRQVGTTRVIAISNPDRAAAASAACGAGSARLAFALADPGQIRRTVTEHFKGRMRDAARERCPGRFSCRAIGARAMRARVLAGALAVLAIAVSTPLLALQAVMAWIVLANGLTTGLRLVAIFARFAPGRLPDRTQAMRLSDYKKLPQVSILVPLLREERVAGKLLAAMAAMDYPQALLDIKLVLEEDDTITRAALDRTPLPATVDIVTVPADALRTKPRAMNYALPFCRGAIVGVYDAEDRPDPAQIRAVVQHLQGAAPDVACVQGYLDFYNPTQNWLARCFTIEYAIWFRVLLHGVQRLGIPIPLGGTTVFFRRRVLEEIGGWDAHNVTEDADLGMRLARFGYRCEMIRSTTREEANCHPLSWIRQRSRWLKGYAITWATHMRDPVALWRDLGWRGFLGFQVLFLGAITSYLALPLFWVIWTGTVGFDLSFWRTLPEPLMWSFFGSMLAGQAVMLVVAAIALVDSGRRSMLPWILTLPFYWPLGAIAAYRAIAEVFYAPFHWHKTEHGIGTRTEPDPG